MFRVPQGRKLQPLRPQDVREIEVPGAPPPRFSTVTSTVTTFPSRPLSRRPNWLTLSPRAAIAVTGQLSEQ